MVVIGLIFIWSFFCSISWVDAADFMDGSVYAAGWSPATVTCQTESMMAYALEKKDNDLAKTAFSIAADKQRQRIDAILHPILHGCAEKHGSLFEMARKSISNIVDPLFKRDFVGAFNKLRQDPSMWQALKTAAGGAIGTWIGRDAERLLFHSGFYNESDSVVESSAGSASLEALRSTEEVIQRKFPDWDHKKSCSGGTILQCPKLGNHSKEILADMYALFDNIEKYENRTRHSYFSAEDRLRVFTFISSVATRICEENLLHAIVSKNTSAPNDQQLKPYLRVMRYLLALPIEVHDIEPFWQHNHHDIDSMLSFLPLEQQREIYDYMHKLLVRAHDPNYGHQEGDSSINLLFSGDTGTGKTYVGKKLPKLLGFAPIILKLEELRRGQDRSCNDLEDLVEGAELSGIEVQLLRCDKTKMRSLTPCNPVCFIDEMDGDRNYSISELKDQFDQFKKIYLPSLGLEIPGFLNCIFTTNNKKFLKDPALISRFVQIRFPKMIAEKKIEILTRVMEQKLQQRYPQHKDLLQDFIPLIVAAVKFDERINIRLLIDNIDCIINFVSTRDAVKNGRSWLVPVQDRKGKPEIYEAFLQRKFGNLNLKGGDSEDDDSGAES